jgi:hypothetical protein
MIQGSSISKEQAVRRILNLIDHPGIAAAQPNAKVAA